jgi:hypothetical protein
MAKELDSVDLTRARELGGRSREVWVRRACLVVVAVIPVLALFNVFGQAPSRASADSPPAALIVSAPSHVRGGLLFQARFTIIAHQEIKNATLNLSRGWAEEMTINTLEPAPSQETSDNGRLSFQLGDIPAGQTFAFYMQFQVNPVAVGSRSQVAELLDGSAHLVSLTRHVTVFP